MPAGCSPRPPVPLAALRQFRAGCPSRTVEHVELRVMRRSRGGANRRALQAATDTRRIFEAWSDEPWVIDGAAVPVLLVCFSRTDDELVSGARLDGQPVDEIYADRTARQPARCPTASVRFAEASGPTLNAGEVVCRLRDLRIVAGGHRIEQPRLCAVDVIGRALPHRLPGSVCPFQLSPPGSRRVPPRISETRPNPAESPPALYQPRQNDLHPVRVLFSWNRAGKRPRHVTRAATGGHRRRFHAAGRCVPSSRRALTSRAPPGARGRSLRPPTRARRPAR